MSSRPSRPTRRSFVKSIAYAGAALPLTPHALARAVSPNGKLHYAGIGVSNMGWSDYSSITGSPKVQVVGICDIDTSVMGQAVGRAPDAPKFQDFRKMFDAIGNDIDAVNVTVPDHMHAYIAMHAMRAGKHVYCQKPLTHTVWEARQMALLAEKNKLTTRMGNQIHSHIAYRLGCRMLRDGIIGKVNAVHSWVGASGAGFYGGEAPPDRTDPVPKSLDWDKWLGVAPERPYVNDIYHRFKWRAWKAFGGGGLGDFGCHIFDPPFTALELTAPTTIIAEQDGMTEQRWPKTSRVSYRFPGTKFTEGDIDVFWYDGGRMPTRDLAPDMPDDHNLGGAGSLFIGTEGQMFLPHVAGPRVYPQDKQHEYLKNRPDLGQWHHWHDWVDACIAGKTDTADNFAYAGPLTETVNLGLIAVKLVGQKFEWDAKNLRITNNAAANAMLTKEYRKGWQIAPA